MGPIKLSCPFGHFTGGFCAHRRIFIQSFLFHSQNVFFGFIPVGDTGTFEIRRTSRIIRHQFANKSACAGFSCTQDQLSLFQFFCQNRMDSLFSHCSMFRNSFFNFPDNRFHPVQRLFAIFPPGCNPDGNKSRSCQQGNGWIGLLFQQIHKQ